MEPYLKTETIEYIRKTDIDEIELWGLAVISFSKEVAQTVNLD